ncbi:MAG: methyltransferase domain-containing protein [Bacteroidales bacterium]|nr:methyltransferase domain-containing protein [Bacteroidales bacterium]
MQERHKDHKAYFDELAQTTREFIIGYVGKSVALTPQTRVLEVGCGEGGILLPFAELGCQVTGVDLSERKIANARSYFDENHQVGTFYRSDFFALPLPEKEEEKYSLVIVHDVFEHIEQPYKQPFLERLKLFMRNDGIAFIGFPGWQMPFAGHQQVCSSYLSKIPFLHLLPLSLYQKILTKKETEGRVKDLLSIRRSKVTIESFERLVKATGFQVKDKKMWFINPHYKTKFHMVPVRVIWPFSKVPYFRNYYTTAAWYSLMKATEADQPSFKSSK